MYVRDGKGAPTITRQLNAGGVPLANEDKRWYDGTVHRILSNETYIGTWWYGKARYVSTEEGIQVYEQPEDEWIAIPFPPLVDKDTWERARVLRRQRWTRAKRNTKVFYLLQYMMRCAECGFLMGGPANTKKEVKRNGKVYKYEMDPPRLYHRCYGYQQMRLQCRAKPMIRAERLEGLVWNHQRKHITERLETLRARLDEYHSQHTALAEKRNLMKIFVAWAEKIGDRLDDLPDERRKEVLQFLLDGVTIDRDNNIQITLPVPIDDFVSIEPPISRDYGPSTMVTSAVTGLKKRSRTHSFCSRLWRPSSTSTSKRPLQTSSSGKMCARVAISGAQVGGVQPGGQLRYICHFVLGGYDHRNAVQPQAASLTPGTEDVIRRTPSNPRPRASTLISMRVQGVCIGPRNSEDGGL